MSQRARDPRKQMTNRDATATTVDGTLHAVAVADRFALSSAVEETQLLHRRLSVFYGYFAVLVGLSSIGTLLSDPPPEWDREAMRQIVHVQLVQSLVLIGVFLALRFRVRGGWRLHVLDGLATLGTCITAAVALSAVPRGVSVDVSAVAFFILFFTSRAALVPSKPSIAALIAAASAIPFTIGLSSMYRRAGIDDPIAATSTVIANFVAAVASVYVVSKTIYGLRSVVERAVQLGQYILEDKIGEGGMGTVYRASHAMLKRPTAIKLIAPDRAGETATARFEREVMAASRLTHPNNVAIYDFGRTRGGVFYYAMELLDGEDLGRLVAREGPQPEARVLPILRQIAAALAEAHAAGLVHRDVKPENVMLCTRGGVRDFVKVLDFGLVKDVTIPTDVKLTSEKAIAGTPMYMAPEAITAPETVGLSVDIYALGCLAFFLLTGRPPFPGENLVQVCAGHVHAVPDAPSVRAPQPLSPELDRLVLRCLEKNPEARPTMVELTEILAAIPSGPSAGPGRSKSIQP